MDDKPVFRSEKRDSELLLGIDPGLVFTGLALLETSSGNPMWTATIQNRLTSPQWPWKELMGWFLIYGVKTAVIESPSRFGNPDMQKLAASLCFVLLQMEITPQWVSPGVWKPAERSLQWTRNLAWSFKTIHERDAYNLARYWLWKECNVK